MATISTSQASYHGECGVFLTTLAAAGLRSFPDALAVRSARTGAVRAFRLGCLEAGLAEYHDETPGSALMVRVLTD